MKKTATRRWPLLIALAMLWATVGIIYLVSIRQNDGQLVYALDDAYIHMAIAKNFSQHGVWGVTRYAFGSSTSSVLWTLILSAIYRLFGVNDISPLVLNVLSATGLVWAVYAILRRRSGLHPLYVLVILLGIIYLTPLPVLIYTGLEHTLHALLSILFLYLSAALLSGMRRASPHRVPWRRFSWPSACR